MRRTVLGISMLIIPYLLFSSTVISEPTSAPSTTISSNKGQINIASLKIKDIEKTLGKKLSFKQKLAVFLVRPKLKRGVKENGQPGNLALIFGILAVTTFMLGLFVPPLLLASLATAIVAVVLGSSAKKKNPSDRKARAAALLGWITLGLIVAL